MDSLSGFLCFNDQHTLEFSTLLHSFQLLGSNVGGAMGQVGVESDWFELKTSHADQVNALLALATCGAEPVLVLEEKVFCCGQRS